MIRRLRNLASVDIAPATRVNLFYGENGSGKTSILEAISLLAQGRSFRSHKPKTLIQHDCAALTVHGRVHSQGADMPLGVSRDREGLARFKANGAPVSSAAVLASYLPVQVINADTFGLLEGSPKIRRQFMDWLVFHVEPGFFPAWKALQRCLKHRNSLLRRDRIDRVELAGWDRELIQLTGQIDGFRAALMGTFLESFQPLAQEFVALEGLRLNYYRGWDRDKAYEQVLEEGFQKDREQGFTRLGCHRADLRITLGGQNAAEVLSRGQQKLLVCALKIAQGKVFREMTGRHCLCLVDDLPSELDADRRRLLVDWLNRLETQVFVTGVEREVLLTCWPEGGLDNALKLFHVEHGRVSETETTRHKTKLN